MGLPPDAPPAGASLDYLLPLVYDQLRSLARKQLARLASPTLQPTELVHEVYLRLEQQGYVTWQNRAHVVGIAATMMRRVLVDRARRRAAGKRGYGRTVLPLDGVSEPVAPVAIDVLALDAALSALGALDTRQAQLVALRVFGGQTVEATAEALGISPATVKREWRLAKAWLIRETDRQGTSRRPS